jgi:hypothetical protein
MAKTVFTGWRTVTPGACSICGYDDGWEQYNGSSTVCDCQRCECGEVPPWHDASCSMLIDEEDTNEDA